MSVTIRMIAEQTGRSIGTVSRALKNQDGLGEDTRALIVAAARDMGYDFGNLRGGRIRRIAFLLHAQHSTLLSSPFYLPVLNGAEEACRKQGIALSLLTVNPAEPVAELIRLHQPDAILCAGFFEAEVLAALRASGKPMVLVDMRLAGYTSANADHRLGGYLATRHLVETGRKRIAMLSGPLSHYSIQERMRGFRKALYDARRLADPDLEIILPSVGDRDLAVREAVAALLAMTQRPDALFCYNDTTALVAMRACLEAGLKVPHDIAIVGFDDISAAGAAVPPLSSISVDKEALGVAGVELLTQTDPGQVLEKVLDVRLVVRESSHDD
ncbi:substrate-binding domain-containing protein [Pseudoduganella sp. DS3]|uniref:Substrate-binding domain-containing protein n=1 Tax=Pseudoduganella guangdongensis TaxID=2692179 RepID=A0A6N9HKS3_9BURK|nr:substrate-binding domain-containing protein [Pseudoduganella guangdongensis]